MNDELLLTVKEQVSRVSLTFCGILFHLSCNLALDNALNCLCMHVVRESSTTVCQQCKQYQTILKRLAQHKIKLKCNNGYFTRTLKTMFYFSFYFTGASRCFLQRAKKNPETTLKR